MDAEKAGPNSDYVHIEGGCHVLDMILGSWVSLAWAASALRLCACTHKSSDREGSRGSLNARRHS